MTDISRYEDMWTTDLEHYAIVELGGDEASWVLFDVRAQAPLLVDDDESVLEALAVRLRKAGIQILTLEEARPR